MTLALANSRDRNLMRLLHPDKYTEEKAIEPGGLHACQKAVQIVMQANRDAQKVLLMYPSQD